MSIRINMTCGKHKTELDNQRSNWTTGQLDKLNWTTGQLDNELDNWTTGQLDNWTTGQLDNWTTGQLDNWTTGQLDNSTTGQLDKDYEQLYKRLRRQTRGMAQQSTNLL